MLRAENYFVIKEKLPSLNEYQNQCRANRFLGAKMKAETENVIFSDIMWARRISKTLSPVKSYPIEVIAEWHEKDKRRDCDNIKSAMKFILDALVKQEIITDDGRKYVTQIHDTIVDDKETFVKIILKENGDE